MNNEVELKRNILEWLKNYYNGLREMNLSETELHEIFVQWCIRNNHQRLLSVS